MSKHDRFSSMHTAAIFKQTKKDNFKVKVDDRFKTLLSDERFQSVPGQVDKYGRKSKGKDSAKKITEEMREFYDMNEEEEEKPKKAEDKKKSTHQLPQGSMDSRLDYLNKLARGEMSEDSSSSDSDASDADSDSSEESDESASEADDGVHHESALKIPDQPEPEFAEDVSSTRIAIQNCDWENVSAEDIMVVMQSFCPPGSGSAVRKVTVFVSDFGKKRMEIESKYGPQGIWKSNLLDEEEEGENEDLYEDIVGVEEDAESQGSEEGSENGSGSESDSEDASGSSGSESGSEEDSEQEEAPKKGNRRPTQSAPQSKKALKGADFVRKNGAVGLVMHNDLETRGVKSRYRSQESGSEEDSGDDQDSDVDEEEEEDGDSGGSQSGSGSEDGGERSFRKQKPQQPRKKVADGDGFDEVALRKYELSKLRYYFAVAECDSARTANLLYEELDGVEMESSSMVFDLSLVPGELDFSDREVRDVYSASASGAVNPNYKPPDFVVNALQHTKVECSWDEGEKLRDRQLSSFSTWRNLNESELQQYVADSASSDDEDEESEAEDAPKSSKATKNASQKKQKKAAMMRKMLLGDGESEGSGDEDHDDFFEQEGADEGEEGSGDDMYGSDGEVPEGFSDVDDGEGEGKTMTYMPELGKDLLAKKRGGAEETPYEAEQRKMAEKKKARKAAKKAYQEQQEAEKKAAVQATKKPSGKTKGKAAPQEEELSAEEQKRRAELELLFDDADANAEDDYDMRELVLAEKEKARGKKSKRRKGTTGAAVAGDDFKVDMQDSRFSKLFEGDSRFGIDKTSTEFRPTPASKDILSEQAKRRAQKEKNGGGKPSEDTASPSSGRASKGDVGDEQPAVDVNNLVNKLKRKYAKA